MPKCFDNCHYPEQALGIHFCPDCKSSDVHVLCSIAAGIADNGNPHPYNYTCVPCFNKSIKKPESQNPKTTTTRSRKASKSDTVSHAVEKGTDIPRTRRRKSSVIATHGACSTAMSSPSPAVLNQDIVLSPPRDDPETVQLIDLTGDSQLIEKNTVAKGSRKAYHSNLCNFIMYLYFHNDYKMTLSTEALTALDDAKEKEETSTATDGEKNSNSEDTQPIHLKNKKKRNMKQRNQPRKQRRKTSEHSLMYSECKRLLTLAKRGQPTSSPIKLTWSNMLAYKMITDYMSTKKTTVQVNKHKAAAFQNDVLGQSYTLSIPEENNDEMIDVLVRMSDTTYGCIQSSISYLYREAGVPMPFEVSSNMSVYLKGSKRLGKGAKQALGLSLSEGKKPMSLTVYRKLCEWLFSSADKEHIFAHLFLVLDWYVFKLD